MNFDWPVYNGDFFPYNGVFPGHYWTGYFTSRSSFKKQIKDFSSLTYSSSTFYALEYLRGDILSSQENTYSSVITQMQRELAKMVHHDAITGTSPNYVIKNYSMALDNASGANS